MSKPTLYALLAKRGRIDIQNGDSINELRTLSTLSAKFDVYYNNETFDPQKPAIGEEAVGPNRAYDYYYIRNNDEVFQSIQNGKKIAFAYPYSEEVFRTSSALLVLTENWKRHLQRKGQDSDRKLRVIYEGVEPDVSCPIINVGQVMDVSLRNGDVSSADRFEMAFKTTGAPHVFGFYGNLNKDLYPYKAFAAIERLYKERPARDVLIALAGRFRLNSEIAYANSLHLGQIPYTKMPALHAMTLANLTNESELNHCLGNQKVIDSLSLGIPMMCQRLDTFVEMLGEDYPCLYETEEDAYQVARQLIEDADFRDAVRAQSLERARRFEPEAVMAKFIEQKELAEI